MKPQILILILILITPIIGCNEKISPSLQESNSGTDTDTDSGGDGGDEDSLYYFKLTNTANASLGYKLHKTGSGNWNADCSIGSDSPLTNENFTTGGVKDITCFLEAEELSIYHSGLKFKIESAPNTCNFIQYVPYSYYNRMPGNSTTSYVKISCAAGVTNDDVTTFAIANPSFGDMIEVSGGGVAGCDEYVNQDLSSTVRESFEEESPNFCRFNYTDRGEEKCDIGTVNVTTYTISKDGLIISSDEGTTATTSCGGKIMDCVKGPVKIEVPDAEGPYKRMVGLQEADKSATQEYSYQGLIEQDEYKSSGSYVYANYRRELANKNIEYGSRKYAVYGLTINANASTITSEDPSFWPLYLPVGSTIRLRNFNFSGNNIYAEVLSIDSTTQITVNFYEDIVFPVQNETKSLAYLTYENLDYASSFNDEDYIKSFDPLVLELYSKNRRIDGQGPNITTTIWSDSFNEANKYYSKPYASDPYLGIGNNYRTNPFYTFECLDSAYEPKARIRMLVRDWDRVFNIEEDSTDENYLSFIENLTDIFETSTEEFPSYARMDYVSTYNDDLEDIFSDYEYYGTNLGYPESSKFNDFDDWDDKLPLNKTSDRYTPAYGRFTNFNFPEDYKVE
jgi:hypothetical protein